MDSVYHGISGVMLASMLPGDYYVAGAIAANLPDLISFPYLFGMKAKKARKDSLANFIEDLVQDKPRLRSGLPVYLFAHTMYALVLVSFIGYLFVPHLWLVVTFGYALHLISDIPTHQDVYATRLFYPFSDWHVKWGHAWMKNKQWYFGLWGILFSLYLIVLIIKGST